MASVTFMPSGDRVECAEGERIFDVAVRAGKPLATACGGQATCGLCRLKVLSGEAHLSAFTAAEKSHLGNVYFVTKVRLGCQTCVSGGDVTIEAPPGGKG